MQIAELNKNAYNLYLRSDNENKRLLKYYVRTIYYDGADVIIKIKNVFQSSAGTAGLKNRNIAKYCIYELQRA